jgi:hypothetical protein
VAATAQATQSAAAMTYQNAVSAAKQALQATGDTDIT